MPTLNRRRWLTAAALAPVAGAVIARAADVASTPPAPSPRESIQARYLPNVVLRTQDDKEVRFYDDLIRDKIVTINFIYSTCADGTCPLITANLVQVQRLLDRHVGRDIFMYSITLNPRHDTPKVLKRYARAYGVRFTDVDPAIDKDPSRHSGNVRYGNEPLMQWAMCQGQATPKYIADSILWVVPKPA